VNRDCFQFHQNGYRHPEEDEINQLLWDTDSDCFTESEDGASGSGSEEGEETGPKPPPQPSSSSSSSSSLWGSNNFSGGAVGKSQRSSTREQEFNPTLRFHVVFHSNYPSAAGGDKPLLPSVPRQT
jgi:hypothetical protein